MKYREIKLEDNKSILVDESADIENKDWYWDENKLKVKHYFESRESFPSLIHRFKIIATINHSIDLNVPMVIVEDEVMKLAKQCFKNIYNSKFIDIPRHYELLSIISKTLNYKATQQKSYSEENLCNLVQQLKDYTKEGQVILGNDEREAKEFVNIFISSLKQEYIELKMEISYLDWKKGNKEKLSDTLQIKTNRVDGQLMAYQK